MPWSIFNEGGGPGAAVTWAKDLLKEIGAPDSPGNEQLVYDWEVSEGGGGQFNPLNQGPDPKHPNWSGGSQYGGGAADYTSWQTGLQGANDYLNMPAYKSVRKDLVNNNPQQAQSDIIKSPWASSHYGYGSGFSNAAIPGKATALAKGGGNVQTTAATNCPSFTSDPIGWATCQASNKVAGTSPVAAFFLNPADAMERIGLVVFGGLLILIGIAILGFGPASRALGIAASTSRDTRTAGRLIGAGGGATGPTEEQIADKQRRSDLAERNVILGERKQDFREARERRIAAKGRHKSTREPNPNPQHA